MKARAASVARGVHCRLRLADRSCCLLPLVTSSGSAFFIEQDPLVSAGKLYRGVVRPGVEDGGFPNGFLLSLQVAVSAAALALVVGVPAALAIARNKFPGRELINTVLMSPLMIPAIVSGSAIYLFYVEFQIQTDVELAATSTA